MILPDKILFQPSVVNLYFEALADPTRRAILALASGEGTVMELAEPFDMSLPANSKHLKVFERARLIARGREAQWRPCRLQAGADPSPEMVDQRFEAIVDRLSDCESPSTRRARLKSSLYIALRFAAPLRR
jgi:DNA-binding transcriptional ArsR family regulator